MTHAALSPRLEADLAALASWLEPRLPCTSENGTHGTRCIPSQTHVHPCPRYRLGRVQRTDYQTARGLRIGAATLLRLLPHVPCTCTVVPHREGCDTWGRLDWDHRMHERHGLTRAHAARRDGERPLDCFDSPSKDHEP